MFRQVLGFRERGERGKGKGEREKGKGERDRFLIQNPKSKRF
jgi:hypothetical protein